MYIPGLRDGPEPKRARDVFLDALGLIHHYTDPPGGGGGGGSQDDPPPDPPPDDPPADPPPDPDDDDLDDDGKPIDPERFKRLRDDRNRKGKAYLDERKQRIAIAKERDALKAEKEKRRQEKLDDTTREKERADKAEERATKAEDDLKMAKREGVARDVLVLPKYLHIVAADLEKAETADPENFDQDAWLVKHKKDNTELYDTGKPKDPKAAGGGDPPANQPASDLEQNIADVKAEIEKEQDKAAKLFLNKRLRQLEAQHRGA